MPNTRPFTLRALAEGDIEAAHRLSVAVGWPHRAADWRAVLSVGQGVCAEDATGRLLGTAMWWPMGQGFATVGMVIVSPELQGRGLGRELMRAVLEVAGDSTLQLNSTVAGAALYASQGFRPIGTVRQYQGIASPVKSTRPEGDGIRPTTAEDWSSIAALDRLACGHDREPVLAALTREAVGKVCLRDGRVAGFAFCRPFGRGSVIGPVIAADAAIARALVAGFIASREGAFLRIDLPIGPATTDLVRFVEDSGLQPAGDATTMVRGRGRRVSKRAKIFALVSQALG